MRVVLLHAGIRGPATYCLNLYEYLKKQDHEVLLISETKWEKKDVPVFEADSFKIFGLAHIVYRPGGILRAIKDFKPDLIHYHWPCGTMDILFRLIKRLNIPVVATIHVSVNSKQFIWDKFFYAHFTLFKRYLKHIDRVISISEFVQNQVRERAALSPSQNVMIYAGINQDIFKPIKKANKQKLNLLFVGQIMPEKGVDLLVRAVRKLRKQRPTSLRLIGKGHLMPVLQKLTRNDDFITWLGFVKNQEKISREYAKADLTVFPTRWDEAFSLVPIESLSCGTPVLATISGGTPEIIKPGKTGYLIPPGNKTVLIKKLSTIKKEEIDGMRHYCREYVLENHTLDLMGQEHEKLYKKVLSMRRIKITELV